MNPVMESEDSMTGHPLIGDSQKQRLLNNTSYYILNLQGDIVRLVNTAGTTVASYTYNAYGKLLSTATTSVSNSATVAEKNPIRYRGYYYDNDIKLYYCQSRYYDPIIGRFLNPDAYVSTGQGIFGSNMYAYCNNNPVSMADTTGTLPFFVITAAIGAVVGAVAGGIIAAQNGRNVWAGIGVGAVAGGLVGAGFGAAAGVMLAGSATASTASVAVGAKAVASIVGSTNIAGGLKMVADNISQAVNKAPQVFWSGGDIAKNAGKQVASNIGGKTLEMTRTGAYLEQINAPYSAWQAASSNFANVANNTSNAIFSIQNASGIKLQSIWASIEYNLLQSSSITYGVVLSDGSIQIMP